MVFRFCLRVLSSLAKRVVTLPFYVSVEKELIFVNVTEITLADMLETGLASL